MGLKGQRDHACAAVARPTGPGHADKLTLSGADHGFECVGNTRSMRRTPEGGRKGRGVSVGIGCVGIGAALGEARGRTDLPEIVGGSMDRKIVTDGPIAPMTRGADRLDPPCSIAVPSGGRQRLRRSGASARSPRPRAAAIRATPKISTINQINPPIPRIANSCAQPLRCPGSCVPSGLQPL